VVTQEEALSQADSATNLYWLINNTADNKAAAPEIVPEPADGATFTEFTLHV
jgi:twitching motility protein PilU